MQAAVLCCDCVLGVDNLLCCAVIVCWEVSSLLCYVVL